jgi:bifunctional DNA-binding transcriptional regulator/antitoxin component of YhaV-PrlF toxin-antitoxin module
MPSTYVMKVSSNGQVSIPAETRARWHTNRVVVVDLGNRVVLRPMPDDAVGALVGKYQGQGPSTEQARARARADEAAVERRKRR